jgi:queuine/archaeosine tRNA-ribosyltransferase
MTIREEFEDLEESLDHVCSVDTECELYVRQDMFRHLAKAKSLYILLESQHNLRLARARDTVSAEDDSVLVQE